MKYNYNGKEIDILDRNGVDRQTYLKYLVSALSLQNRWQIPTREAGEDEETYNLRKKLSMDQYYQGIYDDAVKCYEETQENSNESSNNSILDEELEESVAESEVEDFPKSYYRTKTFVRDLRKLNPGVTIRYAAVNDSYTGKNIYASVPAEQLVLPANYYLEGNKITNRKNEHSPFSSIFIVSDLSKVDESLLADEKRLLPVIFGRKKKKKKMKKLRKKEKRRLRKQRRLERKKQREAENRPGFFTRVKNFVLNRVPSTNEYAIDFENELEEQVLPEDVVPVNSQEEVIGTVPVEEPVVEKPVVEEVQAPVMDSGVSQEQLKEWMMQVRQTVQETVASEFNRRDQEEKLRLAKAEQLKLAREQQRKERKLQEKKEKEKQKVFDAIEEIQQDRGFRYGHSRLEEVLNLESGEKQYQFKSAFAAPTALDQEVCQVGEKAIAPLNEVIKLQTGDVILHRQEMDRLLRLEYDLHLIRDKIIDKKSTKGYSSYAKEAYQNTLDTTKRGKVFLTEERYEQLKQAEAEYWAILRIAGGDANDMEKPKVKVK